MALQKQVYDARLAGRFAESICLAQRNLTASDPWLLGATHFEISNGWHGLGCNTLAIAEVTASLQIRPRAKGGWKETCDWCKQLGGPCEACTPSLRDVDWKARQARENKGPFDLGPPSVTEVIYGDLDSDGSEEAVVRLSIPDVKGQQLEVYAMRNGSVAKIGEIDGGWRSDGGVMSIAIRDRFLYIERSQLAEGDPMGGASLVSSERWSWTGSVLTEDVSFRKTKKQ